MRFEMFVNPLEILGDKVLVDQLRSSLEGGELFITLREFEMIINDSPESKDILLHKELKRICKETVGEVLPEVLESVSLPSVDQRVFFRVSDGRRHIKLK